MAMFETASSLLASKVGAAVAAGALVATAGAAAATLPEQAADQAQTQVQGVDTQDLGTQDVQSLDADRGPDGEADDTAKAVWDVIQDWDGDRGCAFGQSVAAAANGEDAPDDSRCDQADERREAAAERADAGRANADDRADDARDNADRAEDGRANADERAEAGRANAPEGAGPPTEANTGLDTADDARP